MIEAMTEAELLSEVSAILHGAVPHRELKDKQLKVRVWAAVAMGLRMGERFFTNELRFKYAVKDFYNIVDGHGDGTSLTLISARCNMHSSARVKGAPHNGWLTTLTPPKALFELLETLPDNSRALLVNIERIQNALELPVEQNTAVIVPELHLDPALLAKAERVAPGIFTELQRRGGDELLVVLHRIIGETFDI